MYSARPMVKKFLKDNNETLVNVVNIMNANHPDDTETSQNLTNKLLRNTIRFSKVMEIADVLGYEICFKKKGVTENIIIPESHDTKEQVDQKLINKLAVKILNITISKLDDKDYRVINKLAIDLLNATFS